MITTAIPVLSFSFPAGSVFAQSEQIDETSVRTHQLKSPYQEKETSLRILLPDDFKKGGHYRVLFVLPVHEDGEHKHGDGLLEMQKANVHNRHQLICVGPAFTSKPWYADHDQNPGKMDESHLLKTVIPFIEKNYPVRTDQKGRLLIGFSKSGWGALTLLLRHPEVFHKAAGWDIGIRVDTGPHDEKFIQGDKIQENFGSNENFERYRISTLLKTRGKDLGIEEVRLFYFSNDNEVRAPGAAQIHQLMVEERIPHRYVMEPLREHHWASGWVPEALDFLLGE